MKTNITIKFEVDKKQYSDYESSLNDFESSLNQIGIDCIDIKESNHNNLTYREVTQLYASDYFDKATQTTIKYALQLLNQIKNGEFAYDTNDTDFTLAGLRHAVNCIDI